MENRSLIRFKNIVLVEIKHRNIERILNKIYKLNINILDIKYINRKHIIIKVFLEDYNKIKSIKTIEGINIIKKMGKHRYKEILKENRILILFFIFGILFLKLLSSIIFDINILNSNSDLSKYLEKELNKNGIKILSFKKSYNDLNKIKENILNDNKDKFEWLEIIENGTTYIVKFEERKIKEEKKEYIFQDIVASKTGIIRKIEAESGVILKKVNDYVKKGDVVISGDIYNNDKLLKTIKANGKIYGEVWYNIKVEFPTFLDLKEETGKSKTVYSINFLNYTFSVDFNSFKFKTIVKKDILYNNILPFSISIDKHYELYNISGIYSDAEALIQAIKYADDKMKDKLDNDEYIINKKVLNYNIKDSKINVEIFYNVYENITAVREKVV